MKKEDNYLRLPEVIKKVKITRGTIYRLIAQKKFPKQKKIGGSSFWSEKEIDYLLKNGKLMDSEEVNDG